MKTKPIAGIYGDDNVYRAYRILYDELENFIPEESIGAHIKGNTSEMRAKAKMIENLAKNLVTATKNCCPDRK